jgi:hypothetical protein
VGWEIKSDSYWHGPAFDNVGRISSRINSVGIYKGVFGDRTMTQCQSFDDLDAYCCDGNAGVVGDERLQSNPLTRCIDIL